MKIYRHLTVAAALVAATAGVAVLAPQASAATRNGYNGACGSGYTVVNSAPIGHQGTVYLTYNSSNGRNCVVTQRNVRGDRTYMFAYLRVVTDPVRPPQEDAGNYTSYAGPVYDDGRGRCVDWAGGIANQSTWTLGSNCAARAEHRVTRGR